MRAVIIIILLSLLAVISSAQDEDWQQKFDGWLDGNYQPCLFTGGTYYAKVSFADIDGDGDYDMFIGGGGTSSFRLFENYGDQYEPRFRLKDIVYPGLVSDTYKGITWDAEFGDIDHDGDLDVIINSGCYPTGPYHSFRVTNIGSQYEPIWRRPLPDEQQGIASEGPTSLVDIDEDGDLDIISGMNDYSNQLCLNVDDHEPFDIYFEMVDDDFGGVDIGSYYCIDIADLDDDNDYDLIACVTHGVNKYYENIGGPGLDSLEWVCVDSNFLGGQYFSDWTECPELVDIDADGDLDLFTAGAYGHFNFFENTGTSQLPQFVHRYDTLFIYSFETIMNEAQFVDIDNDGDQDIATRTLLLRNVGPWYDPHWEAEYVFFPDTWYREFCDIDGDGDYDMLVPWETGVMLVINIGTPEEPAWDSGQNILSDSYAIRLFTAIPVDLDGDSDFDLILGSYAHDDLIYYENIGDRTEPEFVFVTDNYLGFDRNDTEFDPVFSDIDLDGDLDLLISHKYDRDYRSKLHFYENVGDSHEPDWEFITDDYQGWFSSGLVNHAYVDCGDYDADGDPDILLSQSYGLFLFLNQAIPTSIDEEFSGNDLPLSSMITIKTYPNPFNQSVTFQLAQASSAATRIDIFNILGQRVESLQVLPDNGQTATWNAGELPSGLYFYRAYRGNSQARGKLILLK